MRVCVHIYMSVYVCMYVYMAHKCVRGSAAEVNTRVFTTCAFTARAFAASAVNKLYWRHVGREGGMKGRRVIDSVHAHTHKNTHTHTHIHRHTRTHTHAHTHTHTRTHTHTHAHAYTATDIIHVEGPLNKKQCVECGLFFLITTSGFKKKSTHQAIYRDSTATWTHVRVILEKCYHYDC